MHFRPASAHEPRGYLADPSFSSCTVPLVWYSHYLTNPSHMLRDNAALLFGALKETPWAAHAKVVLMTPEGLGAPGFATDAMQPLSELAVETWAELGSRLPSAEVRMG